jgi:hypothetical protein
MAQFKSQWGGTFCKLFVTAQIEATCALLLSNIDGQPGTPICFGTRTRLSFLLK